jgi:hypothetical protein
MSDTAAQAAIGAAARELHLPTVRDEALRLAEIAVRERQTYLGFLAEVLAAEVDERGARRRTRRITEGTVNLTMIMIDFGSEHTGVVAKPGWQPLRLVVRRTVLIIFVVKLTVPWAVTRRAGRSGSPNRVSCGGGR